MTLHLFLEWQFSAFLMTIVFFVLSHFVLKNHHLKHFVLQVSFATLLILPILIPLLRSNSQPLFSLYKIETSTPSIETAVIKTEVESEAIVLSEPIQIEKSHTTLIEEHFLALSLLVILTLSILFFLTRYLKLHFYCRKLPEHKYAFRELNYRVLSSRDYSVPFCFGIFRPVIVLPESMSDLKDVSFAILHEKGHIKNFDLQFTFVQYFVKILYFWNPLVWLMNRKFNIVQESLADNYACEGADSQLYAKSLINLVKRSRNVTIPEGSSGMLSQKRQLLTRLNAIINEKENMKISNSFRKKSGLSLLIVIASSLILSTGLFAKDTKKTEKAESKKAETKKEDVTKSTDTKKVDKNVAIAAHGNIPFEKIKEVLEKLQINKDLNGITLKLLGPDAAVIDDRVKGEIKVTVNGKDIDFKNLDNKAITIISKKVIINGEVVEDEEIISE